MASFKDYLEELTKKAGEAASFTAEKVPGAKAYFWLADAGNKYATRPWMGAMARGGLDPAMISPDMPWNFATNVAGRVRQDPTAALNPVSLLTSPFVALGAGLAGVDATKAVHPALRFRENDPRRQWVREPGSFTDSYNKAFEGRSVRKLGAEIAYDPLNVLGAVKLAKIPAIAAKGGKVLKAARVADAGQDLYNAALAAPIVYPLRGAKKGLTKLGALNPTRESQAGDVMDLMVRAEGESQRRGVDSTVAVGAEKNPFNTIFDARLPNAATKRDLFLESPLGRSLKWVADIDGNDLVISADIRGKSAKTVERNLRKLYANTLVPPTYTKVVRPPKGAGTTVASSPPPASPTGPVAGTPSPGPAPVTGGAGRVRDPLQRRPDDSRFPPDPFTDVSDIPPVEGGPDSFLRRPGGVKSPVDPRRPTDSLPPRTEFSEPVEPNPNDLSRPRSLTRRPGDSYRPTPFTNIEPLPSVLPPITGAEVAKPAAEKVDEVLPPVSPKPGRKAKATPMQPSPTSWDTITEPFGKTYRYVADDIARKDLIDRGVPIKRTNFTRDGDEIRYAVKNPASDENWTVRLQPVEGGYAVRQIRWRTGTSGKPHVLFLRDDPTIAATQLTSDLAQRVDQTVFASPDEAKSFIDDLLLTSRNRGLRPEPKGYERYEDLELKYRDLQFGPRAKPHVLARAMEIGDQWLRQWPDDVLQQRVNELWAEGPDALYKGLEDAGKKLREATHKQGSPYDLTQPRDIGGFRTDEYGQIIVQENLRQRGILPQVNPPTSPIVQDPKKQSQNLSEHLANETPPTGEDKGGWKPQPYTQTNFKHSDSPLIQDPLHPKLLPLIERDLKAYNGTWYSAYGWKIHLNVGGLDVDDITKSSPETLEKARKIGAWLDRMGIRYKIGSAGDQRGKDLTVYVGSRDDTQRVADALSREFGNILEDPSAVTLGTDTVIAPKIAARFEIHGFTDPVHGKFHMYGADGIPFLASDYSNLYGPAILDLVANKTPIGPIKSLLYTRADPILRDIFGEFYTGTTKGVETSPPPPAGGGSPPPPPPPPPPPSYPGWKTHPLLHPSLHTKQTGPLLGPALPPPRGVMPLGLSGGWQFSPQISVSTKPIEYFGEKVSLFTDEAVNTNLRDHVLALSQGMFGDQINRQIAVKRVVDTLQPLARNDPDSWVAKQIAGGAELREAVRRALQAPDQQRVTGILSEALQRSDRILEGWTLNHPFLRDKIVRHLPELRPVDETAKSITQGSIYTDPLGNPVDLSDASIKTVQQLYNDPDLPTYKKFVDEKPEILAEYATEATEMLNTLNALRAAKGESPLADITETTWGKALQYFDRNASVPEKEKLNAFLKKWGMPSSTKDADAYARRLMTELRKDLAKKYNLTPQDKTWLDQTLNKYDFAMSLFREQALMTPRYTFANLLDMSIRTPLGGSDMPNLKISVVDDLKRWGASLPETIQADYNRSGQPTEFRGIIAPDLDTNPISGSKQFVNQLVTDPDFRKRVGDQSAWSKVPVVGPVVAPTSAFNRWFNLALDSSFREAGLRTRFYKHMRDQVIPQVGQEIERLGGKAAKDAYDDLVKTADGGPIHPDEIVTALTGVGVDPRLASRIAGIWHDGVTEGLKLGEEFANRLHIDYSDTRVIDEKLQLRRMLTFHMWATRNIPFYLTALSQNPWLIRSALTFDELTEEQREEMGLSTSYRWKIPIQGAIPNFFANIVGPNNIWMVNPMVMFSIFDQAKPRFEDPEAGPVEQLMNTLAKGGMALSPGISIPLNWLGYSGTPEPQRFMRMSGPIRDATGIDLEGPTQAIQRGIRNRFSGALPGSEFVPGYTQSGDVFKDYAIQKRISELSYLETGKINQPAYQQAMGDPTSPIYQRALADVNQLMRTRSMVGLVSPFPTSLVNETEIAAKQAKAAQYQPTEEDITNVQARIFPHLSREQVRQEIRYALADVAESENNVGNLYRNVRFGDSRETEIRAAQATLRVYGGFASPEMKAAIFQRYPWYEAYDSWRRGLPKEADTSVNRFLSTGRSLN